MIRRLMILLAAIALSGAVGCGGGEKKGDEAPTEQPESAPMEEEAEAEAEASTEDGEAEAMADAEGEGAEAEAEADTDAEDGDDMSGEEEE